MSNLILGHVIVSNLRNVHKIAHDQLRSTSWNLHERKKNIKYNNYLGLPAEMQHLEAIK